MRFTPAQSITHAPGEKRSAQRCTYSTQAAG